MHDIDRTQLQSGMRLGEQEVGYQELRIPDLFESELLESEGEGEAELFLEGEAYEAEGEAYEAEGEAYEAEGEAYEAEGEAYEAEGEAYETEAERAYADEAWEMELAAELLAVRDEAELEQFLGSLVSSAARGLSSLAKKAGAGAGIGVEIGRQTGAALRGRGPGRPRRRPDRRQDRQPARQLRGRHVRARARRSQL